MNHQGDSGSLSSGRPHCDLPALPLSMFGFTVSRPLSSVFMDCVTCFHFSRVVFGVYSFERSLLRELTSKSPVLETADVLLNCVFLALLTLHSFALTSILSKFVSL